MKNLKGMVLYDLQLDGGLTGVYTNNHPTTSGNILTESATLRSAQGGLRGDGRMEYRCNWLEQNGVSVAGILIFDIRNGMISAKWTIDGDLQPTFEGYGFQMNDKQIAISYWFNVEP